MILVVVALLVFLPGENPHASPEEVVDAFFNELQAHNYKSAFALVDPEAFETGDISMDEEIEAASALFAETPLIEYRIKNIEKLDNSRAVVEVIHALEYRGQQEEQKGSVLVIKRDGKWYISLELEPSEPASQANDEPETPAEVTPMPSPPEEEQPGPPAEEVAVARVLVGEGQGYNKDVPIVVEVTMVGRGIASINIVSHGETPGLSDPAFEVIPSAIIAAQNSRVDVISGATDTSIGIMEAVANAMNM